MPIWTASYKIIRKSIEIQKIDPKRTKFQILTLFFIIEISINDWKNNAFLFLQFKIYFGMLARFVLTASQVNSPLTNSVWFNKCYRNHGFRHASAMITAELMRMQNGCISSYHKRAFKKARNIYMLMFYITYYFSWQDLRILILFNYLQQPKIHLEGCRAFGISI